jgi:SAM-dependent methyltransferase
LIGIKDIKNYDDYVALQKEKTEDPERRKKWESALEINTAKFISTFVPYIDIIKDFKEEKFYCLGARTGEEALALRELGISKALGADLVPFKDHVIFCDIHDMPFETNSVGGFYTNIFDHSLDPVKFIQETVRCLKPGGIGFFQLQIGNDLDKYGVLFIDDPNDFHSILSSHDVEILVSEQNKVLTPHNHALNWNVIFRKNK